LKVEVRRLPGRSQPEHDSSHKRKDSGEGKDSRIQRQPLQVWHRIELSRRYGRDQKLARQDRYYESRGSSENRKQQAFTDELTHESPARNSESKPDCNLLAPGSGPPSGTVQFKVDGANYGAAVNLSNGTAILNTDTLPWGVHTVSAEYSGDGNFSSATNMLPQLQVINTPPVAGPFVLQRSPIAGTKLPLSSLIALDSDADGEAITFGGFSPKSTEGGTVGLTNGWIYYTPPSGPVNADSFTYTIHDSLNALGVGTVSIATVVGTETSPNLTVVDPVGPLGPAAGRM